MSDERTYAPIAERVLCIDFDKTLYPWGPLFETGAPEFGAPEAMRRFKAAGYRLVIFTSRMSPRWLASAGLDAETQRAYIASVLTRDGIPFDDITAEKVPAQVYVDDRAIRFSPGDWPAIADWILFAGADA